MKIEEVVDDPAGAVPGGNAAGWANLLAYNAPAAPEGVAVAQLLAPLPNVFPPMIAVILCPRWGIRVGAATSVADFRPVRCTVCTETYHLLCADIRCAPKGDWKCSGC